MRSQRRGRGRFGIRGRRREERRAKVEVWSSGDGRGEREAGRALGCLGVGVLVSNVTECVSVACTHLEMRSRRSEEERRLVQRTKDLVPIFVEFYI